MNKKSERQEKMFQELDSLQRFAQLTVTLSLQGSLAQDMDKEHAMTWAAIKTG